MGVVILDALRKKCPLAREEVVSAGGEVIGSRSRLKNVLAQYGIPEKFLKEVTTRQAHQDGQRLLQMLDYGRGLARAGPKKSDSVLRHLIGILVSEAQRWFERQNLKIACARQQSPSAWIAQILDEAKGRSGGVVEQHLVGAKLQNSYPELEVPNLPSHAADAQTGRRGDFSIGTATYHVTAAPTRALMRKCRENILAGAHPMVLVPKDQVGRAQFHAEEEGVSEQVSIFAIEDFIATNIVEMSTRAHKAFIEVLKEIVDSYNRRLEETETDMSLRIEIV